MNDPTPRTRLCTPPLPFKRLLPFMPSHTSASTRPRLSIHTPQHSHTSASTWPRAALLTQPPPLTTYVHVHPPICMCTLLTQPPPLTTYVRHSLPSPWRPPRKNRIEAWFHAPATCGVVPHKSISTATHTSTHTSTAPARVSTANRAVVPLKSISTAIEGHHHTRMAAARVSTTTN